MPVAFITGASSGIGAEFARQAARMGYDLYLTARRQNRLLELKNELVRDCGVPVTVLPADLSVSGDVARLTAAIESTAAIDLLINNAGFGVPGELVRADMQLLDKMTNVHIGAMLRLTHAVLPGMLRRNSGAIINVSSVAAFLPTPGGTTYSASKAYMTAFSEALALELSGTGIRVQALCPGFTSTEFHSTPDYGSFNKESIPGFLWLDACDVVRYSLRTLKKGKVICVPGVFYRILYHSITCKLIRPIVLKMMAALKKRRLINRTGGRS